MDAVLADKIEAAESECLRSRVETLAGIGGSPYGARVFFNADSPYFS
jgi:hypothetical protein